MTGKAGKTGKNNQRAATYANAVRALNATAANLSNCGAGATQLLNTLSRTDDSPGDELKARRERLHDKIENIKNLSALSAKAARILSDEVGKLIRGDEREKKDWEKLQAMIRCTGDQIKSEKEDLSRILETLREPAIKN